jgi:hypothetical protein
MDTRVDPRIPEGVRAYTEGKHTLYVMDIQNPLIHPEAALVLQRLLRRSSADQQGAAHPPAEE